jgi:hypothetical protein
LTAAITFVADEPHHRPFAHCKRRADSCRGVNVSRHILIIAPTWPQLLFAYIRVMELNQKLICADATEINEALADTVTIVLCVFNWIFVPLFVLYLIVRTFCS